ncbi:MAG TPA: phosphate signaling complex protein PhoU [Candidatus Eisenbacteria bacterium]|jgi:phosphate transport system protein
MERHFHHDLEALRDRLSEMAGRCETALAKATEALADRNVRLAEEVRLEDLAIDKIELEVESRCIAFLGLQQPVARDLRFLVASIRMSNDLERIGDHAVNIAQGAINLSRMPEHRPLEELPRMAEGTIEMLRDSVTAWLTGDSALARQVCERDVEIDAFKARVFSRLSALMVRDPSSVPRALELLLASRNLERVADLATNIAEEAIFVAEARVIKHHAEEERLGEPQPER